jgi:hypothetical protein
VRKKNHVVSRIVKHGSTMDEKVLEFHNKYSPYKRQTELPLLETLSKKFDREQEEKAQHGIIKPLARGGVWLVPPEKRPKGWELMELKEND